MGGPNVVGVPVGVSGDGDVVDRFVFLLATLSSLDVIFSLCAPCNRNHTLRVSQ